MSDIVFNSAGLRALLESASGPVARDLARRAVRVESQAKLNASGRPGPNVQTGRLRSSITWEMDHDELGLYVDIGSNVEYACVFDASTVLMTAAGPRTIGQIQPGEMVFTQTGEYRAVVAKTAFPALEKPELRELLTPWRERKQHRIVLTLDHKVLAFREGRSLWVHAGDLVSGDLIYTRAKVPHNAGTRLFKNCEQCGRRHQRQGRRYCSQACRDAAWRSGKNPHIGAKRSAETCELLRQRALERRAGLTLNRKMAERGYITELEQEVAAWLRERGLAFEHQYAIGGHSVDFFLPDTGEVIEADGAYWHQDQARDVERDAELLAACPGLEITHLHFFSKRFSPELDPEPLPGVRYVACNPGPASFVDPVHFQLVPVTIAGEFTYGAKHRPHDALKAQLYDLTVDSIHSFVAAGILVSNSYVEEGTDRTPGGFPYLQPALVAAH